VTAEAKSPESRLVYRDISTMETTLDESSERGSDDFQKKASVG